LPADTTYAGVTQGDFTSVTESSGTINASLASLAIDASASFKVRVTVK
jgi:hypothetical protein